MISGNRFNSRLSKRARASGLGSLLVHIYISERDFHLRRDWRASLSERGVTGNFHYLKKKRGATKRLRLKRNNLLNLTCENDE
jgi:hypothetical protein